MSTITPWPAWANRGATALARTHGRHGVKVDDPGGFVPILVYKAPGLCSTGVVDQNANPMIITEPSLHLDEVSHIGEVGSHDINLDSFFPAEAIRESIHSGAIARDENKVMAPPCEAVGITAPIPAEAPGISTDGLSGIVILLINS